jgi:hypothetical protein
MLRFNTPFAARAAVAVPQSLRYIAQKAGADPKANTPAADREKFNEHTKAKNRAAPHDPSVQPRKPRTPSAIPEPENAPDDQSVS